MPRLLRIAGPALLLVVSFAALLLALAVGGAAAPREVFDPGAVVRYGLPIVTLLMNLGVAVTLGSLVLVSFALSDDEPEFTKALDVAAAASAFWTVASAATGLFTFLSLSGRPLSLDANFGAVLSQFLEGRPDGQTVGPSWVVTTLVAAIVTVLCFAVRNRVLVVMVTALAVIGLVPIALQGHSAGAAGHDAATSSLGLHIVFAAIWLGGLVTIVLLRKSLEGGRIAPVIARYSTIAIICFVVVAASGYVNAALRVGTLPQLLTPYGILVLVKVFALGALGLFGLTQRTLLVKKMQGAGNGASKFFWWLVAAELAFMGLASGVAAALAKTATPVAQTAEGTSPSWLLTNSPLPPKLTLGRYFTTWDFDLIWVLIVGFLAFFYVAGVWRLHRRGERWPVLRTVLWMAGLALLFFVTNGVVAVYEKYLFSTHLLALLLIALAVPLLLVSAAPLTLALCTIEKRVDGSRGPREWIMIGVDSPVSSIVRNPPFMAVLVSGSLFAFYYSALFRWATTDNIWHEATIAYFLVVGCLFVLSMVGGTRSPRLASSPGRIIALRLIAILVMIVFSVFFGLVLETGTGLLLADWYGAMGRTWGVSALADQQLGGAIAWNVGGLSAVILLIAVAARWSMRGKDDAGTLVDPTPHSDDRMLADRTP